MIRCDAMRCCGFRNGFGKPKLSCVGFWGYVKIWEEEKNVTVCVSFNHFHFHHFNQFPPGLLSLMTRFHAIRVRVANFSSPHEDFALNEVPIEPSLLGELMSKGM